MAISESESESEFLSEELKSSLLLSSFKSLVLKEELIIVLSSVEELISVSVDSYILLVSSFLFSVSVFVLYVVSISEVEDNSFSFEDKVESELSLLKLPFSVGIKLEFEFDNIFVDSVLSFVDSEFNSEESNLKESFSFWVESDIISELFLSFKFEFETNWVESKFKSELLAISFFSYVVSVIYVLSSKLLSFSVDCKLLFIFVFVIKSELLYCEELSSIFDVDSSELEVPSLI